MNPFGMSNWLKTPFDRDVISRWTVGADKGMTYRIALPPPPDPERFTFLALGDTGDSGSAGPNISPQDVVGREIARDAALPNSAGQARFVLHTGDVIYMTGEKRLYERSFRRPYAPFLCPESTIDNLLFRLPFLPVPGNHDYYDLGGWMRWLIKVPLLSAGVRAVAHELFAFSLPEGGSDMGAAYMNAFVDLKADTLDKPLPYLPGTATKLPNRYYQFTVGSVDFFALDSNTLDAPAPWADTVQVREDAATRIHILEKQAGELDAKLRAAQRRMDAWKQNAAPPEDATARQAEVVRDVEAALIRMTELLQALPLPAPPCQQAVNTTQQTLRRWQEARADWEEAIPTNVTVTRAALSSTSDEICVTLRDLDACLGALPDDAQRTELLTARNIVERAVSEWSSAFEPKSADLTQIIRALSEEALDVQRDLAQARRRLRYRPEDHDGGQLQWLKRALTESVEQRPGHWRVVYLHHPLYTAIRNHAEEPNVIGMRDALLTHLKDRVHLILTGHSHAFEWFASDALPNTGLFVSGGGGQVTLRPSILSPRRLSRNRERYESMRRAGVTQCASAGDGPEAPDGETGPLYHYLQIEVTPDTLVIRPIGVRRTDNGFRREEPMPVYYSPELPPSRPPFVSRLLRSVEIRRDAPPRALWEE